MSAGLTFSPDWGSSPYSPWDLHWRRSGPDRRVLYHAGPDGDVELGVAHRAYKNRGWTFLPIGHTRFIPGLRSLEACVDLLLNYIAVSPWNKDATSVSHMEWSMDGQTWHREPPGTRQIPEQARYYRWIGVGMAHELLRNRQEPETEVGSGT